MQKDSRRLNRTQFKALVAGYHAAVAAPGPLSFESFCDAVEEYERVAREADLEAQYAYEEGRAKAALRVMSSALDDLRGVKP